jgi:hypothetical protein
VRLNASNRTELVRTRIGIQSSPVFISKWCFAHVLLHEKNYSSGRTESNI